MVDLSDQDGYILYMKICQTYPYDNNVVSVVFCVITSRPTCYIWLIHIITILYPSCVLNVEHLADLNATSVHD